MSDGGQLLLYSLENTELMAVIQAYSDRFSDSWEYTCKLLSSRNTGIQLNFMAFGCWRLGLNPGSDTF